MNQQKRFQSNTEFIINLISLFLAHTLSIVIFGMIIKRITPYPKNDTIEYIFVLLISAIIVFLYFSVRITHLRVIWCNADFNQKSDYRFALFISIIIYFLYFLFAYRKICI